MLISIKSSTLRILLGMRSVLLLLGTCHLFPVCQAFHISYDGFVKSSAQRHVIRHATSRVGGNDEEGNSIFDSTAIECDRRIASYSIAALGLGAVITPAAANLSPTAAGFWQRHKRAEVDHDESKFGTGVVRRLDSVDQAVDIIASFCDKRLLHAVVSSNYRLLYRGCDSTANEGDVIGIRSEPSPSKQ